MKNNFPVLALLGCLLSAQPVLSPVARAADDIPNDPVDAHAPGAANSFWTIPPISRQWGRPAGTRHWTIPPVSRRWGVPEKSGHWTIPRTADDMK